MLYELSLINEIEQRAKIIFLSVELIYQSDSDWSLHLILLFHALRYIDNHVFNVISYLWKWC